jgi:hypothetical protein
MGLSPEPSFEYRHRLRTELAGISDLDFLLVRSIRFSCPGHNEFATRTGLRGIAGFQRLVCVA